MRCNPILALPVCLALAACGAGGSRDTNPLRVRLAADPGMPLADMTGTEVDTLLRLLDRIATPCDGVRTLADDLLADPAVCPRARGAARFAARRVMDGYGASDVEADVIQRYRESQPVSINTDDAPTLGPEDAPLVVVIFSDFECPHCAEAAGILAEYRAANPDRLRLVFKNFPLDRHVAGTIAARAAVAAALQGKFWEFHDALFAAQDELGPSLYTRIATALGMDLDRFEADRISDATAERLQKDRAEGLRLGIEATPTLFVNGRRFDDALERLPDWLEEE
jgi:protein-disulfide isomerase